MASQTSMLHIVHIVHRFDTGGLENGMVNLINRLDSQAYRHTIVTMKGHNPDFAERIETNNVTFEGLDKADGNDLGIYLRLNRLLKRLKPDILHTRNTATLEMQVVGWWRRVPLRIHGEHGWDVNDMHGSNLRYRKLRRMIKPFVHQYVALSTEAKDYLLDIIGVAKARVNHICNGVDDQKFRPVDSPAGEPKRQIVFGSVGRLAAVKNHVLLAEAFALAWQQCQQQGIEIKLHLIGDGDCRNEIEACLKQHNCMDAVWMAGNRSDVAELMSQFDVFVLPSLAEGISNTILEAMATGLPVVATDVGGNGELVKDAETGYLVSTDADAMAERLVHYATDQACMAEHGRAGRQRIEHKFSIQAMTGSYDTLYRSVKVNR